MHSRKRVLQVTGFILTTGVFLVDLLTPAGIVVWVLYLPVIFFLVLLNDAHLIVVGCVTCSIFVIISNFAAPTAGNPAWWDLLNRGMGLIVIWLSGFVSVLICQHSLRLSSAIADLQHASELRWRAEEIMRESEERLRLAVQGGGMGTWDEDLITGRVVWSDNLCWMLGYESLSDQEVSREMWLRRVHPDDRRRVLAAQEKARRFRSIYSGEYRVRLPDRQKPIWLAAFGRYVYDNHDTAVRFVSVTFDITRRKELEEEVLRIAAREQQVLGHELHDGVGQDLTGLGLMAKSLVQRLPEESVERNIATRILSGLDGVHQSVREISRGLIPVFVEARGLSAALDDFAQQTTERSGTAVTYECPAWVELPDHVTSTQMFRVAQEAVTNALRHGHPRHIRITLLSGPDGLRLGIKDDGVGMQGQLRESDGLGIRIMEYRAGLISAVLQIDSPDGGGTVVTLTLPKGDSSGDAQT